MPERMLGFRQGKYKFSLLVGLWKRTYQLVNAKGNDYMIKLIICLFYISGFLIIWAMIGYPLSIKFLGKIYKNRRIEKDYSHQPTVTVIIVAHNEEKVILDKLNNVIEIDYPKNKIEFIIASDNSTDKTNDIVRQFIKDHPDIRIQLYETKSRKGKTNAQNEASKIVTTEYIVMTDANSILDKNSIKELMAAFISSDIAYVSGRLVYINKDISETSIAESSYWDFDLSIREIEGKIQTITAGNGAIYACRTKDYYDFDPIECHDSAMPVYYALQRKRAIANHGAIAYEKTGENVLDEFKRKVRMNRVMIRHILPDIRVFNFFRYKWFSYFYFGHRTCRYLLWILHLILLLCNIIIVNYSWFYLLILIGQILFCLLVIIKAVTKSKNRILTMAYYYVVTIIAQWIGAINILTGKAKPYWEKVESTR